MKKYLFILSVVLLVECKKDSTDVVGTWTVDKVTWDHGSEDIGDHSITFTDNGRWLYDGVDKGTYLVDGSFFYFDGEATKYEYELGRKSLVIHKWYYTGAGHISFPNLTVYLSK